MFSYIQPTFKKKTKKPVLFRGQKIPSIWSTRNHFPPFLEARHLGAALQGFLHGIVAMHLPCRLQSCQSATGLGAVGSLVSTKWPGETAPINQRLQDICLTLTTWEKISCIKILILYSLHICYITYICIYVYTCVYIYTWSTLKNCNPLSHPAFSEASKLRKTWKTSQGPERLDDFNQRVSSAHHSKTLKDINFPWP